MRAVVGGCMPQGQQVPNQNDQSCHFQEDVIAAMGTEEMIYLNTLLDCSVCSGQETLIVF